MEHLLNRPGPHLEQLDGAAYQAAALLLQDPDPKRMGVDSNACECQRTLDMTPVMAATCAPRHGHAWQHTSPCVLLRPRSAPEAGRRCCQCLQQPSPVSPGHCLPVLGMVKGRDQGRRLPCTAPLIPRVPAHFKARATTPTQPLYPLPPPPRRYRSGSNFYCDTWSFSVLFTLVTSFPPPRPTC